MNLTIELRVPLNEQWLKDQADRRHIPRQEIIRELAAAIENSVVDSVRWKDGVVGSAVASTVSTGTAG